LALIFVAINYHICHEAHLFEISLKNWPVSYQPTLHMPIQHYLLREQIKGSCYITINGELGQSSSECQIIMYLQSTLIWKDPMRASIFFSLFILLPISKLVESYVKVKKLGKIWDKIQCWSKKQPYLGHFWEINTNLSDKHSMPNIYTWSNRADFHYSFSC
jgi:hypothetical protein